MTSEEVLVERLKRIDERLDFINAEIETFLDSRPYSTRQYLDAKASEHVYRARIVRPPRPILSVAIGEFLHNVNSALDNVAWQLAGPEPPRGSGFPIMKTASEYRRQWTRSSGYYATRGMSAEAQAIIEDAQPYHRGHAFDSHPLWVLRRLANEDKHQTLHLVGSAVTDTTFEVVAQRGMTTAPPTFFPGPFEDGAIVARHPVPRAAVPGVGEMQVRFGFAYGVAFAEGPASGRPVNRVLTEIRNEALGTVVRLLPLIPPTPPAVPFEPPPHETEIPEASRAP